MTKISRILSAPVMAFACAFLLAACGGGSDDNNPNPPPPSVITAHVNIPASVDASSTFTVKVSLTAADNSNGTASVELLDVGTVTPKIDCGSAQTLSVNGPARNFTCQAPQVDLGNSNTHQLQVNVNGKANLASPAPIKVVNGGLVDVKLTNAAGTVITTAKPGQQIKVAFNTITTPAGDGKYTVSAPSGWTVGSSSLCVVNAQSTACQVDVTVASSASSGAYAITIDAQEGSSPLSASSLPISVKQQPPAVISAHATIPSKVDAGSTFTVVAWLTSSDGPGGKASVQIVDVGTVTPQISCGQAQTLDIGGAHGSFSCQAPQVNLGSSNTHHLQVDVDNKPNFSSPIAVAVANGGRVDVQLTSAAGTAITAAKPGQTVNVAFSTLTSPLGKGKYTLKAPSSWAVGNGGVCEFTGQASCKVPVGVASSAANGSYTLNITAQEGSSKLSTGSLQLAVQKTPPTPADDLAFALAQNIADTLYANLPSQATTFTYNPVFLFKNTSSGDLAIDSVTAGGFNAKMPVKYGCNIAAPSLTAAYPLSTTQTCTLHPGQLYAVSGNLDNSFPSPASATAPVIGAASISISVQGAGKPYIQYDMPVTFVRYVPTHVAVRVVNKNTSTGFALWIAASYGPDMVTFGSTTPYTGTYSPGTKLNFKTDQKQLPDAGSVVYLPYGPSGGIFLTRAANGFDNIPAGAAPTPSGSVKAPPFVQIEFTYVKNLGLGNPPCNDGATTCESLTVDQTYVNFINTLGTFNTIGNTAPLGLSTQSAGGGVKKGFTKAQVFQGIADFFNQQGPPWAYDSKRSTNKATPGLQNYVQHSKPGDASSAIIGVLAPIQVFAPGAVTAPWPVPYYDPMKNDYYDNYIRASWAYLKTHPIYIEAPSSLKGAKNCILQGQITPASSPGTSGQLVFSQFSGTCPQQGDAPNNIAFYNLDKCDFVLAAGGACTHAGSLFGPNNTYRSVLGQAIAAYQAIGLFPCAGTDPGKPMSPVNAQADVKAGKAFSNPACLGLPALPPTWNVYAAALRPYVDVYTYSYGDFLGIDRTVTFSVNAFAASPTLYKDLPVAQPVTIYLR